MTVWLAAVEVGLSTSALVEMRAEQGGVRRPLEWFGG